MLRLVKTVVQQRNAKLTLDIVRCAATAADAKPKSKDPATSQSFVMNMFRGVVQANQVFPFPNSLTEELRDTVVMLTDPLDKFFQEVNNPDKNDLDEVIEKPTLDGLWDMGAFSIQVPHDFGGLGLTNTQYAALVEIVGKNDLAVGICLGAHQSIGFKGILLYGTPEQKAKYLPRVSTGKDFAAFCLTEPSAGSDAGSVKSRAVPSADGKHWILNGSKIWISNGGFAEIMTVFAQTPFKDPKTGEERDKVTAFIVERSFGGVTSGPPEKKMGIKASNTTEVYYDNVKIPSENILGGIGNGFKVAMNILNNGRFGMAAALAGTMRSSTAKAVEFATQRTQFGQTIATYGGVQEKIGRMAMLQYITESLAFMISGNMDLGSQDYHLEAAISKVFASEAAWTVTDEAIQVLGGMGFMRSSGLERTLRDLRIFRIFEGTNDILRLFVALTGIQHAGSHLKELQKAMKNPTANLGMIFKEAQRRAVRTVGLSSAPPMGHLVHPNLSTAAAQCAQSVDLFGASVEGALIKYGKGIIDRQFILNRLAQAAIDTYTMAVVLSRCTTSLNQGLPSAAYEEKIVKVWCQEASDRVLANTNVIGSSSHLQTFANLSDISKAVCEVGGIVQQNPVISAQALNQC